MRAIPAVAAAVTVLILGVTGAAMVGPAETPNGTDTSTQPATATDTDVPTATATETQVETPTATPTATTENDIAPSDVTYESCSEAVVNADVGTEIEVYYLGPPPMWDTITTTIDVPENIDGFRVTPEKVDIGHPEGYILVYVDVSPDAVGGTHDNPEHETCKEKYHSTPTDTPIEPRTPTETESETPTDSPTETRTPAGDPVTFNGCDEVEIHVEATDIEVWAWSSNDNFPVPVTEGSSRDVARIEDDNSVEGSGQFYIDNVYLQHPNGTYVTYENPNKQRCEQIAEDRTTPTTPYPDDEQHTLEIVPNGDRTDYRIEVTGELQAGNVNGRELNFDDRISANGHVAEGTIAPGFQGDSYVYTGEIVNITAINGSAEFRVDSEDD